MTSKRDDKENFIQICGYVPASTGKEFKAAIALHGLDQSEGISQAISHWLEVNKKSPPPAS